MHRVLLLGAGKIGRMIVRFLSAVDDYEVVVADACAESLERIAHHREIQPGVRTRMIDASNGRHVQNYLGAFHALGELLAVQHIANDQPDIGVVQ